MRAARLEMALAEGLVALPATGQIAVWHPQGGDDLSALPRDRVRVITPMKPDHAHFAVLGYRMEGAGPDALAILCLPRARALAHALIHRAMADLAPGGHLVLDGQKTDGIEPALKELRGLGLWRGEALSKAHGKLAVLSKASVPDPWAEREAIVEGGFITLPGVFSADGPDRGSVLLAQALPGKLPAHMADLGAGWGYLARAVLAREGVKSLDLIEADARALACARRNIADERARFLWEDATRFRPPRPWQGVVMNPPFHVTREATPSLGLQFLRAAQGGLSPDGTLWMVANRHLPYAPLLAELFHEVDEIGGDAAFRVVRATAPRRPRRG